VERLKEENGETSGKAKTFRFMKHYTVFNASQCDGMPEREAASEPVAQIVEADDIIKRMPRAPKISGWFARLLHTLAKIL
jgi:antirestriction protein ArdC